MKKIILPLILVLFSLTTTGQTIKEDKKAAIKEMKNSSKALKKAIKGLSEAQLNFKSTPESWSVAECVEHITISEHTIIGMYDGALKEKADPSKRSEVKLTDDKLMGMMRDRSGKVKTPKAFEPSGKYGSYKETLAAFCAKRKSNINALKKTDADLRNLYAQSPFGTIDALQVMLFISSHSERHIAQIEEVKSSADFPVK